MDTERLRKPGDVVAERYEIIEFVGVGSFAEVYRSLDKTLDREVAIKLMRVRTMIKPGMDAADVHRKLRERFAREAAAVAKLNDPYTVTLFDSGADLGGDLYMAFEFIPGLTLREYIARHGALAPERVVKILQQALSSLREAHVHGLMHRDIKPENLMIFDHLGQKDQIRVVDFGIAKAFEDQANALTAAGQIVGTPRYVSPERVYQKDLMPASDLYSLGAVAYYLLVGEEVYAQTKSPIELIKLHASPDPILLPESSGVPKGLRVIIEKMLAKELGDRYGAAQQIIDDLEEYVLEEKVARRAEQMISSGMIAPTTPAVSMANGRLSLEDEDSSAKTEAMEAIVGPQLDSRVIGQDESVVIGDAPQEDPTEMVDISPDFRDALRRGEDVGQALQSQASGAMPRRSLAEQSSPQQARPQKPIDNFVPLQPNTFSMAAVRRDAPPAASGGTGGVGGAEHAGGLAQRTSDISSAKTEATPAVQVPQAKQEKASPSDGKKKEKPPLGKYLLIAGVVGFVLLLLMAVVAFLLWKFVINPG